MLRQFGGHGDGSLAHHGAAQFAESGNVAFEFFDELGLLLGVDLCFDDAPDAPFC